MSNRLIKLPGPPSASTYGNEGDFYFDTVNEATYICKGYRTERIDHGFIDTLVYQSPDSVEYIWEQYGGGVEPEEISVIVKENFPGGVGYEEVSEPYLKTATLQASGESGGWAKDIDIANAIFNDPSCATFTYYDNVCNLGDWIVDTSYSYEIKYKATSSSMSHSFSVSLTDGVPNGNMSFSNIYGPPTCTISALITKTTVHKIDAKFLPAELVTENTLNVKLGDIESILDSINGEVI